MSRGTTATRAREALSRRARENRSDVISIGDNLEEMKGLVSAVKQSAKRLSKGPAGKRAQTIFQQAAMAERAILTADRLAEQLIKQYAQLG